MNNEPQLNNSQGQQLTDYYMNNIQIKGTLLDTNVLIAELGRATGKTEGFMGPRTVRVGFDMPGELSFLVHRTYVSLMTNVVPAIRAYYTRSIDERDTPFMVEGRDFVIGASKLPKHFTKPKKAITYPKHSMVLRTGHHFQLVASDQPDSVAGASGVHAFIEEMKHNKGQRLKSRLFPALRGAKGKTRESQYYQGITGVSDTARVDLGEDNWFEEYENAMNDKLISEIFTVAKHVNDAMVRIQEAKIELTLTSSLPKREKLLMQIRKSEHVLSMWTPILRDMRRNATLYLRTSTFANKDFLGQKFFSTQLNTMTMDEFLVAICGVRRKKVENMFFTGFTKITHCFADSYIYNSILDYDLKETFTLDAQYLKYFDPNKPLDLGYDPGNFQSFVVGQERKRENEYRILKEFYCWTPRNQGYLAAEFFKFFGQHHKSKRINLYYDRAGNKRKVEQDKITSDAEILKRELESFGFRVKLMNERQRTIFLYEHHKLLEIILSETLKQAPRLRVCENECKNLVSAIFLSPLLKDDGKIDLDKSSERLEWRLQPGLSTQIPTALMYLIFGKFSHILSREMRTNEPNMENAVL